MQEIVIGPWPLIRIGELALPTYYVVMSAVFLILVLYIFKRAERKDYSGATAMDLFLWVAGGGAIGARLLHVIYEAPAHYLRNPGEIFYFWQGGFVFFGGVIGGLIAGWLAVRLKRQSFALWADFTAPVVSLGYALGRFACYFAGCCHGRTCDLPWALPFTKIDLPTGVSQTVFLHPTQLYAVVFELAVFTLVLLWERRGTFARQPGSLFAAWLAAHSVGRIVMEMFRGDDRGPLVAVFSVSTVLSAVFIAASLLFLIKNRAR